MARLVLADDHKIFLDGLRAVLESQSGFSVVELCTDGEAALAAILEHDPDVAVLDISMPGRDGLSVAAAARQRGSSARFVMLSMYDEPEYVAKARAVGASGYVPKESATAELTTALRAVLSGEEYFAPALASARLDRNSAPPELGALTPAELNVFWQLSKNCTSREIAEQLGVSYRTVQNHRANICSKLGLSGANRLLEFAMAQRSKRSS
jgi:DNA-binding NarL/FixJ family response regulator